MKPSRHTSLAPRALLYHFSVCLKLPRHWQASLMPKRLFTARIHSIPLDKVKLYSNSDPSPPKRSKRFCFKTAEEKKMHPLTSISSEMTDDSPRSCVHNTLRDLFIYGEDFRQTSQYKRMTDYLSTGISMYNCKSKEDIDAYFERLDCAYHSIKKDGYKSQQELGLTSKDEIRIHITENGTLCLGSKGNHRFRIAELLGIERIPCVIYGVNFKWIVAQSQKTRLPPHKALLNWMENQKSPSADPATNS